MRRAGGARPPLSSTAAQRRGGRLLGIVALEPQYLYEAGKTGVPAAEMVWARARELVSRQWDPVFAYVVAASLDET